MLVLLSSPSQDRPRVFLNPRGSDELCLMPRVKETMVCLAENKCRALAELSCHTDLIFLLRVRQLLVKIWKPGDP